MLKIAVCALVLGVAPLVGAQESPQHFVYFGRDRARIRDSAFLRNPHIAGAQLRYMWNELESARDQYTFPALLEDVALLERHGKRLFIQLQDVSFNDTARVVPDYLRTDPAFGGGVARKYEDEHSPTRLDGIVARRWDPAVRARLAKLLDTLGGVLDGRIAGINLAETSIGFGESGRFHPSGFTYESYANAIKSLMTSLRSAFRRSDVIVYANFMPGEWLPENDRGYLRSVYAHADSIGVGVGGPDLLPYRPGQRKHSLPLIAARRRGIIAGVAVQDGNLAEKHRGTGKRITVEELVRFATDTLRLNYIFWGNEEPYYSKEILPYLSSRPK